MAVIKTEYELARGPKLDELRALIERFSDVSIAPRVSHLDDPRADIFIRFGDDGVAFADVGLTEHGRVRLDQASVPEAQLLLQLEAIGKRFAGVDVQYRRPTPKEWLEDAWEKGDLERPTDPDACTPASCWRVRIIASKNERKDFRIVAYGGSFKDAAQALIKKVPGETTHAA